MLPYISLFGRVIGTYQILALAGLLLAGFFACRATTKRGLDDNDTIIMLLIACCGTLVAGHLLYAVASGDIVSFFANLGKHESFGELWNSAVITFGGMVYFGGLIGGMIAGYIYVRARKLPLGDFSDVSAPALPLFHTFGRIGCFLAGCCYGVECHVGFKYENSPIAEANGVTRFPVQLAEALFNLFLFVLLSLLLQKDRLRGRLFPLYLVLYSCGRFGLEFLRGDAIRGGVGALSTSQIIAIFMFLFGAAWFVAVSMKASRTLENASQNI